MIFRSVISLFRINNRLIWLFLIGDFVDIIWEIEHFINWNEFMDFQSNLFGRQMNVNNGHWVSKCR